ncbi:E3 ubiquitin-protein ligase AMFR-like [Centruroides sculpturatus]|nr:E3 ubiquitin-protein ligase AMFR-like [Centruroides sculpturatus]
MMFPNMPFGLIMDDLRVTHSVEQTVENILDERLVPPPSSLFQGVRSISQTSTNQENGNAQAIASTSREYLEAADTAENLSLVPYGENSFESVCENERYRFDIVKISAVM